MVSYFEACVKPVGARCVRGVLQLIDFRHPPMPADLMAYKFISNYRNLPVMIVATKADRVSKNAVGPSCHCDQEDVVAGE